MSEVGALTIHGPGHITLSRTPEDVQAAWLEELRPAIEALMAGFEAERIWWALTHRTRSRLVTRRKQRNRW